MHPHSDPHGISPPIRSSELVARRAVGYALDPALSVEDAARLLADDARGDRRLLEAARVRILRAAVGPASQRAANATWMARQLLDADDDADADAAREVRRVLLVGMPGAGKGTQGGHLARLLRVPHISMGDLIREVAAGETPFAFQAQLFMERGHLVPDSLVLEILAGRFAVDDVQTRGFVLDGFPRTIDQAVALDALLGTRRIEVVVDLVVAEHTARERLRSRGRTDDTDDAVTRRVREFEEQTAPVLYWYRSRAARWSVDGDRIEYDVARELAERVDAWGARRSQS